MSYQLIVLPLARLDVLEAVHWYEDQQPGLGLDLADQVDAAIQRAAEQPLAYAAVEGTTRRILCNRFPYAVFFRVVGKQLVVLAIAHVRRNPKTWRTRATNSKP